MSTVHAKRDTAFWIKWGASILQIFGYAATGFGLTPWNIYFFIFGLARKGVEL